MNRARYQFLAGPTRSRDQDRGGAGGDLLDQAEDGLHLGGCADQAAQSSFVAQAAAESFVFGASVQDFADVGKNRTQAAEVDRLFDIVLHAEASRMECGLGGFLGGDHNDRDRLRHVGELLHQFHSAHARHLDVGDHDRRSELGNFFQSFEAVGRSGRAISPARNQFGQPGSLVLFVFDNQYAFLRHIFLSVNWSFCQLFFA